MVLTGNFVATPSMGISAANEILETLSRAFTEFYDDREFFFLRISSNPSVFWDYEHVWPWEGRTGGKRILNVYVNH